MPPPKKLTGTPAEEKHPGGRPTKYDPKYCDAIIEFFSGERNREIIIVTTGKNDYCKEEPKLVANALPTFERFAHSIGVNGDTLVEWAKEENKKKYPGFSAAYKMAKEKQKDFLVENGLMGLYNPAFAIFTAKNITDMRDQQEIKHSGTAGFILNVSEVGSRSQEPRTNLPAD